MENYEKKYKEALEWARQVINGETGFIRKEVEEIFPELAESEDEKIRKELIEHIKANKWADYVLFQKFSPDDVIAWLEKQESVEEIVGRCKDSWYNEGKIAGMAEGLSDEEKYQQGWHDALEKQGEQNSAWSEEDEKKIKKVMHIVSLDGRISNEECKSILDWLESLKERCTWKPSNIQMECLHDAVEHYHTNGYPASKLNELYEQMSKIYKL